MSKWVIENIELIKKTYVVEAYGEPAAKLTAKSQAPTKIETIGEVAFDVTAINEYEYNKDWSKEPHQKDWVGAEITTGGKLRHKSEWIYAKDDGRLEKQRLKGPDVNEIR